MIFQRFVRHHEAGKSAIEDNRQANSPNKNTEGRVKPNDRDKMDDNENCTPRTTHRVYSFPNGYKKPPWMTDNILNVMKEGRKYETKNEYTYGELKRTICKKYREAKQQWLLETHCEIEQLHQEYETQHTLKNKPSNFSLTTYITKPFLHVTEEKLKCRKEYITDYD